MVNKCQIYGKTERKPPKNRLSVEFMVNLILRYSLVLLFTYI